MTLFVSLDADSTPIYKIQIAKDGSVAAVNLQDDSPEPVWTKVEVNQDGPLAILKRAIEAIENAQYEEACTGTLASRGPEGVSERTEG